MPPYEGRIGVDSLMESVEDVGLDVGLDASLVSTRFDLVCPKCKSAMMIRTRKKGTMVGTLFYGCTTFPKCNGWFGVKDADLHLRAKTIWQRLVNNDTTVEE